MSLLMRRSLTTVAALLGLALEFALVCDISGALPRLLLSVMIPTAVLALVFPWGAAVAAVAVWPLFVEVRRTLHAAATLIPAFGPAAQRFDSHPAYPWLPALMLCVALPSLARWAMGGEFDRERRTPDALRPLAWLWLAITVMSALVGLFALNPAFESIFWRGLADAPWHLPFAAEPDPWAPLAKAFAAFAGLALFAALRAHARTPERRRVIERALVAAAVLCAVSSLITAGGTPQGLLGSRASSSALLLAGLALLAARLGESPPPTRATVGRAALILLLLAGLWISGTRLATLLVLASAGAAAVALWLPRLASLSPRATGGAVVLGVVWGAALLWPAPALTPETSGGPRRLLQSLGGWVVADPGQTAQDAFSARAQRWDEAWHSAVQSPLWGLGLGAVSLGEARRDTSATAGNQPLQTWAESGLLGLAVLLGLFAAAFSGPWSPPGPRIALVVFAAIAVTASLLVDPEMQFLLWVLLTLLTPASAFGWPRPVTRGIAVAALAATLVSAAVCWRHPPVLELASPFTPGFGSGGDDLPGTWLPLQADLPLDVERARLLMPIYVGHVDAATRPVTATVSVNGDVRREESLSNTGWHLWVINMEPWVGERVTLSVSCDRTWPALVYGLPDPRAIGLGLGAWEWLDTTLSPEPPRTERWPLPAVGGVQ